MSVRVSLMVSALCVLLLLTIAAMLQFRGFDTTLGVLGLLIGLPQFVRDYVPWSRQHATLTAGSDRPAPVLPRREYLPFEAGLYGGLVGGTGAGALIALAYLVPIATRFPLFSLSSRSAVSVGTPIIVFAALTGALLGCLSEIGVTELGRRLAPALGRPLAILVGGIVGGTLSGVIMGPVGGWYFGQLSGLPVVSPAVIVLASGPAILGILLTVAMYRGTPISHSLVRDAAISTVAAYLVFFITLFLADVLGMLSQLMLYFVWSTAGGVLLGGLYFGMFCGAILGLAVGLSFVLAQWSQARRQVAV